MAVVAGGTAMTAENGRLVGTVFGLVILGIIDAMMIMFSILPCFSGAVQNAGIPFCTAHVETGAIVRKIILPEGRTRLWDDG